MAEGLPQPRLPRALPLLHPSQPRTATSHTKFDCFPRENSSKGDEDCNMRGFMRTKETVLEDQTNRTLLKSVTAINRAAIKPKQEPDSPPKTHPQTKLLKKTQQLTAINRSNQTFRTSATFKNSSLPTAPSQSDPTCIPLSTPQPNSSEDLLQATLLNFHSSQLGSGVTLRIIDREQE